MPQTMHQKRKSSLARLKNAAEQYAQIKGAYSEAKTVNLARMIQQTEAAIAKGGR